MTQPIDPTMWPKVEGRFPETGYYFSVNKAEKTAIAFYCTGDGVPDCNAYYGPITFATPIPATEVTHSNHKGASMIHDQELPIATELEAGRTYFRIGSDWKARLLTPRLCTTPFHNASYYGPIDTTPQVIDLSHFDLSKIEAKKQPDKPGFWWISDRSDCELDGGSIVTKEMLAITRPFIKGKYRFLCDFIQPRQSPVIPKKPENVLHLMRLKNIISPLDGNVGDLRWCIKRSDGHYRILLKSGAESGRWWANCQCEPVTE